MKLARISLLAIATVSVLSMLIMPISTKAVSGADFKPGRIIDDAIFTNKDSMTALQIQSFLDAKVPTCEINHSAYNASNPPPYTCLKDYQENTATGENNFGRFNGTTPVSIAGGKSAAQIIWEASQQYNINPQVMIVLLQKEQGLVTDTWPLLSQFTKATGYLCPDTAACNSNAGGFGKQVFGAAWQFRNDFNGIDTPNFYSFYGKGLNNIRLSPDANCGTKSVNIENQATAVLYKYTPYTPNAAALNNLYGSGDNCSAYGNRNFWRYFNDWFGSSQFGNLVSVTGGGVYFIENNTKRAIPNEIAFISNGFKWANVSTITASTLAFIPDGPPMTYNTHYRDGYLVSSPSGGIYVIENGFRRPFPNEESFFSYGYKLTDAQVISAAELNLIPDGVPMPYKIHFRDGQLIYSSSKGVFLVENGKKKPFPNEATFFSYGYSWSSVRTVSALESSLIPDGIAMTPKI